MKGQSTFSLLKNLWDYIPLKRRFQIFWLIFFIILSSVAEIISIGSFLPFIGALTNPEKIMEAEFLRPILNSLNIIEPPEFLFLITVIFVMAIFLSSIMRLALLWFQSHFAYAIGADISTHCYRSILYSSYLKIIANNSSEFITGIVNKNRMIVTQVILPSLIIVSSGIILIVIFIILLFVDPLVAITVTLSISFTYGTILFFTKKRLLLNSNEINKKSDKLVQSLQESFGGIRDVIIDGSQESYCNIFRGIDLPLRKAEASITIFGQMPRFVIEATGIITLVLLAYSFALRPQGVSTAIPVLGVFALAAQRLLPLFQQIYQSLTSIFGCSALVAEILSYLNQGLPKFLNSSKRPLKFNKGITLDKINFRYSSDRPLIIKDFSFEIKKGDRLGLIGKTGGGKSTLLDLIMGLLIPQSGQMYIDGKQLTIKNYRSWQSNIAHVPQFIFLADSTILENIAFGTPPSEINHKLVYECAKKAQISEVIESWPLKYDTQIGERGVKLSGGQKQRVGIARALYKQTNVIIFDEATSSLDYKTEEDIINVIEKLGKNITIIIVAHRLTSLRMCSKILEVENGEMKIIENYQKLLNSRKIK